MYEKAAEDGQRVETETLKRGQAGCSHRFGYEREDADWGEGEDEMGQAHDHIENRLEKPDQAVAVWNVRASNEKAEQQAEEDDLEQAPDRSR